MVFNRPLNYMSISSYWQFIFGEISPKALTTTNETKIVKCSAQIVKLYEILIFSVQSRNDKDCLLKNLKRFIILFRVIWRPTRGYARAVEHLTNHSQPRSGGNDSFLLPPLIYVHFQLCNTIVVNSESAQVIRNKLQQKHLPMPTLVNCSRSWLGNFHTFQVPSPAGRSFFCW